MLNQKIITRRLNTMQSFLMINSLFKTIEYKLVTPSSLKITELSSSGSQQSKTYSLNSVNIEEGQTAPSFLPWLILILGAISLASLLFFSKNSEVLSNNIISAASFLTCIFGALAFLCKPTKTLVYRDSFSNNILFQLDDYETRNNATKQFVTDLNMAIEDSKEIETDRINLKSNEKLQYEIHNKNVDDLFNSGLIDEALYNRICKSMHKNIFGKEETHHAVNNVVYLNR